MDKNINNSEHIDESDKFTEAFNRSLGNDIKRIREEMQLTQPNLAELLKIEPRYLQKIEGGKVSIKTHIKIMFQISILNSTRQFTTDYTAQHSEGVAKRLKAIVSNLFSNEDNDR